MMPLISDMLIRAEAVLFDLDGTLVDTTVVVERTWRAWAARYGIDPEPILRVCHGRRTIETIREFAPAGVDPVRVYYDPYAPTSTLPGHELDATRARERTIAALRAGAGIATYI